MNATDLQSGVEETTTEVRIVRHTGTTSRVFTGRWKACANISITSRG